MLKYVFLFTLSAKATSASVGHTSITSWKSRSNCSAHFLQTNKKQVGHLKIKRGIYLFYSHPFFSHLACALSKHSKPKAKPDSVALGWDFNISQLLKGSHIKCMHVVLALFVNVNSECDWCFTGINKHQEDIFNWKDFFVIWHLWSWCYVLVTRRMWFLIPALKVVSILYDIS